MAAAVANVEKAMTRIEAQLIERLGLLPPERVAEVLDFVEFLATRVERGAAARRLADGLARLDALGLPPMSEDEIGAEVREARRARPAKHHDRGASGRDTSRACA